MKHVYEGKTKSVFLLDDGNYLLKLKDDATGENGVFDPGANTVGLTIAGLGKQSLLLTKYFFEELAKKGFETHFISADIENATMTVKPAVMFGKGLEVICRFKAVGSFFKRYGTYVKEGQELDSFVEVTLKDDMRLDPPISKDALEMLGILSAEDYDYMKSETQKLAKAVKDIIADRGAELLDIKFEFGKVDGKIILIDEISVGNMRVVKDGKPIEPMELADLILKQ